MFHTNLIRAPALLMLSKTDPIGAVSSNTRAKESWENMGMEVSNLVSWECFILNHFICRCSGSVLKIRHM